MIQKHPMQNCYFFIASPRLTLAHSKQLVQNDIQARFKVLNFFETMQFIFFELCFTQPQ